MKKGKDTKQRLFEVMSKVDSTFKSKLNEFVNTPISRDEMKRLLEKVFKLHFINDTEDFNGGEGGLWISAEDEEEAIIDGFPLFDYYNNKPDKYEIGIHKEFIDFLNKYGWYAEWHDLGTIILRKKKDGVNSNNHKIMNNLNENIK